MINKEISKIIQKRRSIFPHQFNGQKINKEIVLQLLKNANTAPTHRLTQPWFFKVFSGNSKQKLADELIHSNTSSSELFKNKITTNFKLSSHIICVCMRRDHTESIPEWEEIASVAMSVQNIWLSCVDSQIGGYWSTPKGIEKLNNFLNLKTKERCLGLFYLGAYDSLKDRVLNRKNIEQDIQWLN